MPARGRVHGPWPQLAYNSTDSCCEPHESSRPPSPCFRLCLAARRGLPARVYGVAAARSSCHALFQAQGFSRRAYPSRAGSNTGLSPTSPARHSRRLRRVSFPVQPLRGRSHLRDPNPPRPVPHPRDGLGHTHGSAALLPQHRVMRAVRRSTRVMPWFSIGPSLGPRRGAQAGYTKTNRESAA